MHEQDGMHDAIAEILRTAIAVASHVGERAARERAERLREATRESQESVRTIREQIDRERGIARSALAPTARADWWERATPQQIADAWGTAVAWREADPQIATAATRIRSEVIGRFDGLDPEQFVADGRLALAAEGGLPLLAEAVREAIEGEQLAQVANDGDVADVVDRGGPPRPPRARIARELGGRTLEQERSR